MKIVRLKITPVKDAPEYLLIELRVKVTFKFKLQQIPANNFLV